MAILRQKDRDALKEWEVFHEALMRASTDRVNLTQAEIARERERLEKDPVAWILFFFPDYAAYEFAPFHLKAIRRCTQHDEWYEVLSWARSLAKSTTVMFIVLYLALTGRKKNVIMASATQDSAVRLLAPYKEMLESNGLLRAYYGSQVVLGSWSDEEFVAKCGCSFRAVGAGNAPRGSRNGAMRPDVLLVDDYDTDQSVRNPDTVNKMWEWWEKALYPTRDPARALLVIFCGNLIARDCCVVRAGNMANHWDVVNIRDKDGRSTWPAKNSEEKIDETLSKISTASQQTEYFNNPITEGEVFQQLTYGRVPPLTKFPFLVIYGDPAPGENRTKNSSTKSCILMGQLAGKVYIIKARLDRGLNAEFIDWYVQLLDYVGGKVPVYCYMENNKLQDPFFQQVFKPLVAKVRREREVELYIHPDEERKTEKATRIEANLEPLNREGNLIFNEAERDDPHMKRLDDQFRLFTLRLKFPADGPDCVEGGLRVLKKKVMQLEPVQVLRPRRRTRRL
ncbi:hypothetical protein EVA_11728 [gut metagenome]|uniref:Uncharacterized protein n=1 Tax=gut metagenome TaxID=749906 RepID=J9FYW4_9ZZZZ